MDGKPELIYSDNKLANSASQWCLRTINLYDSTSTNNTQAL